MSMAVHQELLRFVLTKTDDPDVSARQKLIAKTYIEMEPELLEEATAKAVAKATEKVAQETRLTDARSALRRVLARRKLALSADEEARIDACTDVATLSRWLDQAIDAKSAPEALL